MIRKLVLQVLLPLLLAGASWATQLDIGSLTIPAGSTSVTIPITLTNSPGTNVAAVSIDIIYDPNLLGTPTAAVGPAGTAASKDISAGLVSSAGANPADYQVNVLSISNQNVIGDGVVANVTFPLKTASGMIQLTSSNAEASDPNGDPVVVSSMNGNINFSNDNAILYNVTGDVSTTATAGRIFVGLQGNGGSGYGTTIKLSGTAGTFHYTIHGVPPGNYNVNAFLDGGNTGSRHANDPVGSSSGFTIVNADASAGTISLTAPSPSVSPVTPGGIMAIPGNKGALVQWDTPKDNSGNEIADSYNVSWSTSPNPTPSSHPGGNTRTVTASEHNGGFMMLGGLTNGTVLYFSVQAISANGLPASDYATYGPVPINAANGGATVNVTVNSAGITKTGPLFVAVGIPEGNPPAFYVASVASPSDSQLVPITGVQPGTYQVFAILDQSGNGFIDPGDFSNTNGNSAPTITVVGTTTVNQSVTLANVKADVSATVDHSKSSNGDGYSLSLNVRPASQRPVMATVNTAGGVTGPIDITFGNNGSDISYWTNLPGRPAVGNAYNILVTFSDDSTQTFTPAITAVLDNFPNPSAPVGSLPPSPYTDPTPVFDFSWTAPTSTPGFPYGYRLRVEQSMNGQGGNFVWSTDDSGLLPSTQLSIPFNNDGKAHISTLTKGALYSWWVSVVDTAGNSATSSTGFVPMAPPTISNLASYPSFTSPAKGWTGDTIVINGSDFGRFLASDNTVKFSDGVNPTPSIQGTVVNYQPGDPNQLQVQVPAGAKTGPVSVTTAGGSVTSSDSFILKTGTTLTLSLNPTSIPYNTATNATATVSSLGATGSVLFYVDGVQAGPPVQVNSATASLNISGSALTVAGSPHTIRADYGGDSNYGSSSNTASLTVTKANQNISITTPAPATAAYGSTFSVAATAPGGSVVYSSGSPSVCTNSGALFTMISGTGTCIARYDQPGDSNYNTASQVTNSTTATKIDQNINITNPAPASAQYGSTFTVAATAPGGPVVYSSGSPSVCTNNGATFTMISAAGSCTVQYDQNGTANYKAAQITSTTTASPAVLSVMGLSAVNKQYDGGIGATINGTPALSGIHGTDNVSIVGTPVGTFNNKSVGNAKPVTVTGLSLSGTDSANYVLAAVTLSANITVKQVTVTGLMAQSRTYNGTTAVTITGTASTIDLVNGDAVSLTQPSSTGAVATKTVGTAKPVTLTGLGLTGGDAGNYNLSQPALAVDITPAPVNVVNGTASSRVYNGTTAATVTSYGVAKLSPGNTALYGTDQVTVTGGTATFDTKDVGTGKTVTITGLVLGGADAANYALTGNTTTATANITAAALAVKADAQTKVYGSNDPTLTYQVTSGQLFGADAFTGALTRVAGETVAGSSYAIQQGNLSAGTNYTLTFTGANLAITKKSLGITGISANNKVYDGTTAATLNTNNVQLTGVVGTDDVALSGSATGTFADKNVGQTKQVNFSGLSLTGTTAGNYSITATANTTANITPAPVNVVNGTASSRVYNGTTSATVTSYGVAKLSPGNTALYGTDQVTVSGGAATFDTKDVGTGKTVTITGLVLGGADAVNYALTGTTTTATANITAATLAVKADAQTKVYGSNDPALTYQITSGQLFGTDVFTGALTRVAGETVAGSSYAIQQGNLSAGTNYTLTFTGANLTITKKPLGIAGITANNKVYDGTTAATLNSGSVQLTGIVGTDDVALSGTASGTFADKNVGQNKPVNFSGLSLTGTTAGNYSITTTANTTANITPAPVNVVNATASSRAYNGTTAATVTSYGVAKLSPGNTALYGADQVTVSGGAATFDTKDVGTGKTVTITGLVLGGADAVNYALTGTTTTATANITAAALAVKADAQTKVYGSNDSALTYQITSGQLFGTDVFTGALTRVAGETVAGSPYAIQQGSLSAGTNYTLTFTGANLTITKKPLGITGITANNKEYNGTTAASLNTSNVQLTGVVGTDDVSLSGTANGTFADKNVGQNKQVNFSGLSLTGTTAGNYSITTTANTTANITPAPVNVVNATASSRAYNGTTSATVTSYGVAKLSPGNTALYGTDQVTVSGGAATFDTKDVGTGKTVTITGLVLGGADAVNYALTGTTTTATANITAATLAVKADAQTKVYGSNDPALTYQITSGQLFGTDVFTGALTRVAGETVAGSPYAIQQGSLSAGTNYMLTFTGANLTITKKPLGITGITANNKEYNGTTAASLNTSNVQLTGVVGTDDVSLSGTAQGTFSNKNVGVGKTVNFSGLSLTGTTAGNYSITTTASTTADITAKSLTVSGITASNKTYDGTTTAALVTTGATLTGVVSGDVVTIAPAPTGTFDTKNVGTGKTVTIANLPLAGTDGGNYKVTTATTTANITPAVLTIAATDASRPYDSANPTFTTSAPTGFVNGETVAVISGAPQLDTSATMSSPAGNYPITITLGTLTAANGNYTFNLVNGTLVVQKAPATVTFGNLAFDYTGSPITAITIVNPTTDAVSGNPITVSVTYNGSTTAPSAAGTYAVLATVTSGNYQGYATGTMTIVPSTSVKGDVNGDGKVTVVDALLALQEVSGLINFTTSQKSAADVNADTKVDVADVILLLKKAAGLPVNF